MNKLDIVEDMLKEKKEKVLSDYGCLNCKTWINEYCSLKRRCTKPDEVCSMIEPYDSKRSLKTYEVTRKAIVSLRNALDNKVHILNLEQGRYGDCYYFGFIHDGKSAIITSNKEILINSQNIFKGKVVGENNIPFK
jgi:hypothetical protein